MQAVKSLIRPQWDSFPPGHRWTSPFLGLLLPGVGLGVREGRWETKTTNARRGWPSWVLEGNNRRMVHSSQESGFLLWIPWPPRWNREAFWSSHEPKGLGVNMQGEAMLPRWGLSSGLCQTPLES